ncbi:hypothetical protein ANCCAN_04813 [Ancylostoma caninum]|uniref:Uncharacterized protein n=1 Tax=Ancylostoma caninum TaxID=29170 RepID=A0A368GZV8_ANCCA|nr:hypothetical protein ANCCAN_04813 [Ancylostoma caninum]
MPKLQKISKHQLSGSSPWQAHYYQLQAREFQNGAIGLWYMLYMLSRVYPENSRYISSRLNRPLSEWVPVREWARLHDLRESEMAWYVPGEKAKELVKSLLEKFVFPFVSSLRDAKMDRFTNLSFMITNIYECTQNPQLTSKIKGLSRSPLV